MDHFLITKVVLPELNLLKTQSGAENVNLDKGLGRESDNGFRNELDRQVDRVARRRHADSSREAESMARSNRSSQRSENIRQDPAGRRQSVESNESPANQHSTQSNAASENRRVQSDDSGNVRTQDNTGTVAENEAAAGASIEEVSDIDAALDNVHLGGKSTAELDEISLNGSVNVGSVEPGVISDGIGVKGGLVSGNLMGETIVNINDAKFQITPPKAAGVSVSQSAVSQGTVSQGSMSQNAESQTSLFQGSMSQGSMSPGSMSQSSMSQSSMTQGNLLQGEEVSLKLEGMETTDDLQLNKIKLFDKLIVQSNSELKASLNEESGHRKTSVGIKLGENVGMNNSLTSAEVRAEGDRKGLSSPPLSTQLNTPMGKPNWGAAFNQRIMWMVNSNTKAADIQIYPPDLGPIKVKLQVNSDQVQVQFVTQSPVTKEALDQAMPKLREMFEQEGLDLVDVDVKDQSSETKDEDAETASLKGDENTDSKEAEDTSDDGEQVSVEVSSSNIVDHYV
ncbi:MAG: flagellar hook-length control protein FliK [Pseudomonadales bacterium]|nr:flagellar hook-length control protein FliK [Pseudomonadales bacterium]